jgi:hypothetical protein
MEGGGGAACQPVLTRARPSASKIIFLLSIFLLSNYLQIGKQKKLLSNLKAKKKMLSNKNWRKIK